MHFTHRLSNIVIEKTVTKSAVRYLLTIYLQFYQTLLQKFALGSKVALV